MRYAAIDIGTNTMLLQVADLAPSSEKKKPGTLAPLREIRLMLADELRFVKLGQGVHQARKFAPEAMERARATFKEYAEICKNLNVAQVIAVATSASRDSSNAKEFYAEIEKEFGIRVDIIPGEMEANLSFLGGLLPNQTPEESAILDIGGGSTEFVHFSEKQKKVVGESLNVGCVRLSELFLKDDPYTASSIEEMEKYLKKEYSKIPIELKNELKEKDWVAIAGTPTTIAALELGLCAHDANKINGMRLDRCLVSDWMEALAIMKSDARKANPLLGTGRGDVIVSGACILLTAMEFFEKEDVVVSSRGLREGLLLAYPN